MKLKVVDRRVASAWQPVPELVGQLERVCAPAGPAEWSVNLVWVDDVQMRALNRDYRAVDCVTDVLSFSYLETSGRDAPALVAGSHYAKRDFWLAMDGSVGEAVVGEVVIAPAFVLARSRSEGWPSEDELALLTVHGVLHILGWEHADAAAAAAMRVPERELLRRGGFGHPLGERESTN